MMTALRADRQVARPPFWDRFATRALSALVAAALGVDATVHLRDAGLYAVPGGGLVTEAHLFRTQAVVAILVAVGVLIRPGVVAFTAALLVTATAAAAVLIYTYVDVGAIGPIPDLYEPTWALPGKRVSAVAELCGAACALAGAVSSSRHRRPGQ